MTFRTSSRRGYNYYHLRKNATVQLLLNLGAILILNKNVTNDAIPKAKNLGSGGAVLDGTMTDIIIDANGFNFNGTTSRIVIPTNTLLTGLTSYSYVFVGQAINGGGGDGGRLWGWANGNHTGLLSGAPTPYTITRQVSRDTTSASATNSEYLATPSVRFYTSMRWDGSTISGRIASAGDSALTNTTSTSNGSGTVTNLTGLVLNIGARTLTDRTWNGYITWFAIINKVISDAEDLSIARSMGVVI